MRYTLTGIVRLSFCFCLFAASASAQITGPTTVYLNTTTQYSYDDGSVVIGPSWTVSKGSVVTSWNTGTTYFVTVNWTATGSGWVKFSASDGQLDLLNLTVSTCSISAPTPPVTGTSRCGAGPFTLVATPGSGGTSIKWYTVSTGGSAVYTGASYLTPSLPSSTTYYITTYNTTSLCESSPRTAVPVTVDYTGTLSPSSASVFTSYSGPISLIGSTGAILRWEKNVNSGGWTTISNTTSSYTYAVGPVSSNSITLLRAVLNNVCGNPSYSTQSTINVYAPPQVLVNGAAPSGSTVYNNYGYGVTLSIASAGYYTSYQWRRDGVDIAGATSNTHVPALGGLYGIRVTVTGGATATATAITVVQPNMQGDSVNMISKTVFFESGVTTATARYAMQPNDLAQVFSYTDGTGRIVQKVAVGQSATGGDIVIPSVFGKNGILDSVFLPYSTSSVKGRFRPNSIRGSTAVSSYTTGEQYSAYQNTPKVATDSKPYSVSLFQNTPESRVKEQGLAGNAWQPGSTRTVRSQRTLSTSTVDPVLRWKANATTTGYYPNNTVWVETITDENGNKTKVFTDKRGLTVLKKVQANSGATLWLQTYYVFDDYGQLIMEIPPKAMDVLGSGTTLDANVLTVAELVFKYTYDARGRLIQKKVPGTAIQCIVYDNFDRVVLTQDGNQRALGIWMFTKYDIKNRKVYTGKFTSSSDRATLQNQLDNIDYNSQPYFETPEVNVSFQGYSNTVFPTTNLYTLNFFYYDDYDFNASVPAGNEYSYDNAHISGLPTQASSATRGLLTGSKTRVLGTTNWLVQVIFYDNLDRPLQVLSNNHLMLTALENPTALDKTSIYYVPGTLSQKIQTIRVMHTAAAVTTTVTQRFTYDNSWRTIGIYHSINLGAETQLAAYEYNALGQLVAKKLHNTGSAFLQTVDMRFNIRGWLTSINNAQLVNDSGVTNNDTNDYFGLEVKYNIVESGLANVARFDGSISATKWKHAGSPSGAIAGSPEAAAGQRSYKYSYDNSDRLLTATFQANSGSAWNAESNTLDEAMTYESNGNIQTLLRKENVRVVNGITVTSTATTIDNLTYTYYPNVYPNGTIPSSANRLLKVVDGASATKGFKDINANIEYKYDTLGSMSVDVNKGITAVIYNELGKPTQMTLSNGSTIVNTYDGVGNRLKSVTTVSGPVTTTTDYINGFVYNNGLLTWFSSPEGRVVKNGSTFEYQYALTDHQGNTRALFTSLTQAPVSVTANMEGATNSNFSNYNNRVLFELYDHTDFSGSTYQYSQKLAGSGNATVGVAKSYKVFGGDKVKIEAWAKYQNMSGSSNLSGFATALLSAFGLSPPVVGEVGTASAGLNSYGLVAAAGSTGHSSGSLPKAFVNILVFDKNYNLIDAAWDQISGGLQVGASPKAVHDYMMAEYTAREEGYVFLFVSNENPTLVDLYFDDVVMTYTRSNLVQYNEYYPFGMQTQNSWTRDNVMGTNFLANGGTELNNTTGLYDLEFRNYDPVLGRLTQVDPLASVVGSYSTYQYSYNSPANFNDPTGLISPGDIAHGNSGPLDRGTFCSMCWVAGDQAYNRGGGFGGGGSNSQTTTITNPVLIASFLRLIGEGKEGRELYGGFVDGGYQFIEFDGFGNFWVPYTNQRLDKDYFASLTPGIGARLFDALAKTGEVALDPLQFALDIAGFIPGAGEAADLVNAGIYSLRGDATNASLSAAAAVPFAGWAATGGKLANRAHTVYTGVKNGKEYFGITVNLNKRYTVAQRAAMDIRLLFVDVPGRNLARAIEQTLINGKGLGDSGNLANLINSISPANQLGKFSETMKAAKKYMGID